MMKKQEPNNELRNRAEELMKNPSFKASKFPEKDIDKLIHELEVHQIELELQNEVLKNSFDVQSLLTKKYNDLFEFAPVGYLTLEKRGKIRDLNHSASHITGYSRSFLSERNFSSFITKETLPVFTDFFTNLFKKNEVLLCEINFISQDHILNLYLEGKHNDQEETCMIAVVDISSMKKTEHDLRSLNQRYMEAIEIKDKLLSIIGHDLKGPLTRILMLFEMFGEELGKYHVDKFDNYIDEIIQDTEQALSLLENLVTWAKLKTGVTTLRPEKVRLKNLCETVNKSLADKVLQKNISVINNIPESLIIQADPNLLKIVLSNFLTNAIKFTFEYGKIEFETLKLNKSIEVIIRDNGTGMTPESLWDVFSPTKHQQSFGTSKEPGSGIGLILCRELITMHGGECWIESRKDEGTSVHFTVGAIDS